MRAGAVSHADGEDARHGGHRKHTGARRVDFSLMMSFVGCANIAGEIPFSQPRSPLWS